MQLCFLKPYSLSIPRNIELLRNFGEETVFLESGDIAATGEVVCVKAESDVLIKWLDGKEIWVGNGMLGFTKKQVRSIK